MSNELTVRQQEVLDFMVSFLEREGYPARIRDIQEHFGLCGPNAVMNHLYALVKKGAVITKARGNGVIYLPKYKCTELDCPYCGEGILIEESLESDE